MNDAPMLFAYLALPEDEEHVRHCSVTKKPNTSPSHEFSRWGWSSVSAAEKAVYAKSVGIYRGTGSLETALGWIVAYWAGPAAWRAERLDCVARAAGAVRDAL